MTGTDTVAKAEPDGYTIGISIGGPLAINTLLFSKMPYEPFKDVALITVLTNQPSASRALDPGDQAAGHQGELSRRLIKGGLLEVRSMPNSGRKADIV